MNEVLKQIEELGIVPVVVLNDAKDAAKADSPALR